MMKIINTQKDRYNVTIMHQMLTESWCMYLWV